jgi:hypothetical protein
MISPTEIQSHTIAADIYHLKKYVLQKIFFMR